MTVAEVTRPQSLTDYLEAKELKDTLRTLLDTVKEVRGRLIWLACRERFINADGSEYPELVHYLERVIENV